MAEKPLSAPFSITDEYLAAILKELKAIRALLEESLAELNPGAHKKPRRRSTKR
jgi:hypothetical protein